MFSFLGRLFGSDKATESLITHVSNGLDKIYYSDQEKAETKEASQKEASTLLIEWLKTTQGSNLARRTIALMVTSAYVFQWLICGILGGIAPFITDPATEKAITASHKMLSANGQEMSGAMLLVLGFYFAAPHMASLVGVAMDRFTGKKSGDKK